MDNRKERWASFIAREKNSSSYSTIAVGCRNSKKPLILLRWSGTTDSVETVNRKAAADTINSLDFLLSRKLSLSSLMNNEQCVNISFRRVVEWLTLA